MVKVPVFDERPLQRPDPQHFLMKKEGSPAGLDVARKRLSASISTRPKKSAQKKSSLSNSPAKSAHNSVMFWKTYERGDLPVLIDQARPGKNGIKWKNEMSTIDLHYYLPIFLDGITETQDPHKLLAVLGTQELIQQCGERVLPVIPQLIVPLKTALKSDDESVVATGLHVLQMLVTCCPQGGEALLPYYRQIIPPLNKHVHENLNIGDAIDYGQRLFKGSLGDLVKNTLNTLEEHGGPNAFINIKYLIPTYESCIKHPRHRH